MVAAYEGRVGLLCCVVESYVCHYVPAPLVNVAVDASILDLTAKVRVTQTFTTSGLSAPQEAVYVFPVDAAAAVTGFEAHIGDRVIKARLEEKQQARRTYEAAKEQNLTTALLESDRPDIFAVRLGNLVPGESVRVVLYYVTEVALDAGRARFYVPTSVAPRYSPVNTFAPPTAAVSGAANVAQSYLVNLSASIAMSDDILFVESPTHQMTVDVHGRQATAKLQIGSDRMDRDIVLHYAGKHMQRPMASKCTDPVTGLTTLALSMVMNAPLQEIPSELIFVIDCSGSMSDGNKIVRAREAMQVLLRGIPTSSYFNIVLFGSKFTSFAKAPVAYDDDSLANASQYVARIEANLGGTEILQPLESIYATAPRKGLSRSIFVLTDGQVSNESSVISLVAAHASSARVFSLGIGESASHHLVTGIARVGRGSARFITNAEELGGKVSEQLRAAIVSTVDNVTIDWDTGSTPAAASASGNVLNVPVAVPHTEPHSFYSAEHDIAPSSSSPSPSAAFSASVTHCPRVFPPIVPGDRITAYAVARPGGPCGHVRIRGSTLTGPLELSTPVVSFEPSEGGHLLALASRALVREIEDGAEDPLAVQKQVAEVALRGGIASSATSWVAVDDFPRVPDMMMEESVALSMPMATAACFKSSAAPVAKGGPLLRMARSIAPMFGGGGGGPNAAAANRSMIAQQQAKSGVVYSASAASAPMMHPAAAPTDPLVQFIMMQGASGLVKADKLADALRKSKRDIETAAKSAGVSDDLFATLVWIAVIKNRFGNRESEWKLPVDKAINATKAAQAAAPQASAFAASLVF